MSFNTSSAAPRRVLAGFAAPQAAPVAEAPAARPEAQFWMNIGIVQGDEFISLPKGLPLDTMEPEAIRGGDEFRRICANKNALLDQLLAAIDGELQPGEEIAVPLTVVIRRLKPKGEVAAAAPVFDFGFGAKAEEPAVKAPARRKAATQAE